MDSELAHRSSSSGSGTGERFIYLPSRFTSSNSGSIKISSKSILSPGRTDKLREPQISLMSSLSRRLRSNGSMKGGQASPMFPAAGKKRGCGFENPEPSSPKVTCIGQVRVKKKKQGKKMRSMSKRRGEVSFRKIEQHAVEAGGGVHQGHDHHLQAQQQERLPHRNQRWVHLPLTICEALRAFGADFNYFLPCHSSCTSGEREKAEKEGGGESSCGGEGGAGACGVGGSGSCVAVFARWLVARQEGEKGREIELVVGEEDDERAGEGFHRRHVFDDIEIKLEEDETRGGASAGEEARVSICVPPKNALLLMRCRFDPNRMEALTNKYCEPPLPQEEEEEEEDGDDNEEEEDARNEHELVCTYTDTAAEEQEEGDDEDEEEEVGGDRETRAELETSPDDHEVLEKRVSVGEIDEENNTVSEERAHLVTDEEEEEEEQANNDAPERNPYISELEEENLEEKEVEEEEATAEEEEGKAEEVVPTGFPPVDSGTLENEEVEKTQLLEEQEGGEPPTFPRPSISSPPPSVHSEPGRVDTAPAEAEILPEENDEEEGATVEKRGSQKSMVSEAEEEGGTLTHARPESDQQDQDQKARETDKDEEEEGDEGGQESNERESRPNPKGETKGARAAVLPDCLLLMMCEPKLSMEVSKETWVCSTDFVRSHPDKLVKQTNGPDQPKTRLSTDSNPSQQQLLHQPPRSSCSFPAAAAGGVSMATMIEQKLMNASAYEPFVLTRCKSEPMRSTAKLAADACFWKNRKLEPHRPRVGAAGVGF